MPLEIITLLIGAGIASLTSFVTIVISSHFQVRREREQREWDAKQEIRRKWWDQKLQAYMVVIRELTTSTHNLNKLEYSSHFLEEDELENLFPPNSQGDFKKLERAARQGAFLLSEHSVSEINKLISLVDEFNALDEGEYFNNRPGWFSDLLQVHQSCLDSLVIEAKKDLGIDDLKSWN